MSANSRVAWDDRFLPLGHWDQIGGDAMTLRFAELILEYLHEDLLAILSEPGCRVLDWGCARGQLVALFRRKFPKIEAFGLDFSYAAVDQAIKRYGPCFFWDEEGRIFEEWDVIVTSNVMEHLVDPIAKMREHLERTRKMYVILTPFAEPLESGAETPEEHEAAGHVHLHSFTESFFPKQIDGFARAMMSTRPVPGPVWPYGHQLLIAYRRL